MFDIGFLEMFLVAIVALLVLGPERMPAAVRMAGLYLGRIKRSLADVRSQVEREIGADELRQTLHNEKVMAELAKQPAKAEAQPSDSKTEKLNPTQLPNDDSASTTDDPAKPE